MTGSEAGNREENLFFSGSCAGRGSGRGGPFRFFFAWLRWLAGLCALSFPFSTLESDGWRHRCLKISGFQRLYSDWQITLVDSGRRETDREIERATSHDPRMSLHSKDAERAAIPRLWRVELRSGRSSTFQRRVRNRNAGRANRKPAKNGGKVVVMVACWQFRRRAIPAFVRRFFCYPWGRWIAE
jgi:hypothetical protein